MGILRYSIIKKCEKNGILLIYLYLTQKYKLKAFYHKQVKQKLKD